MSCEPTQTVHGSGSLQPVGLIAPDTTANLGRVLVWMKPSYIGDAVMATCLIDELAKSFGRRFIRCSNIISNLYSDRSEFLEYLEPANIRNPRTLIRHAKELRLMNLDAVVLVDRSFRSALAAKLAGVPVRIGHSTEGRAWLLTQSIRYNRNRFEADSYLDLLAKIGLACDPARPHLSVSAGERQAGAKLVAGCTVGMNPGGRHSFKLLPYRTTVRVAQMLQKQGYRVVLLGGQQDKRHAEELVQLGFQPDIDLVGKTTLREALGALSNLRVVFGSDSGLMHMAAAVGTPTVTVFGKEPASKWGYNYEPHVAIQALNGQLDLVDPGDIFNKCIEKLAA